MFWKKKKEVLSLQIISYDCTGCGNCVNRCRRDVLSLVHHGKCNYAVVEHPEVCVGCGNCVKVCKANAIELITI